MSHHEGISPEGDADHPDDQGRRDFLEQTTIAVAGVGLAAATWPFISSMNPTTDVVAKASTEVDLSNIAMGHSRTVSWQGKPVFIVHRTPEQVASMNGDGGGKEPQPDEDRVEHPEWLVVVGICTHLGCVPARKNEGWVCPCHGSVYDNSGRILRGPAPKNLLVPPYEFLSEDKIVIKKA